MMKKPDEFKQNRYLVTKIRIILIAFFCLDHHDGSYWQSSR